MVHIEYLLIFLEKEELVEDLLKIEQGKKVVANKVKELRKHVVKTNLYNIPTDVLEMV